MVVAKKPKNIRLAVVSPVYSDVGVYETDSLIFRFSWSSGSDIGVDVTIENNSQSRVYIEWSNTRLDDEPICFGTDNVFTYQNTKPDEVIHKGSKARRFVARQSQFSNEYKQLFYWDEIKKYGHSMKRDIIIPIKQNGVTYDHVITLQVISDDVGK